MDNDYDAIEEELYYNDSYREFIAIRNNFYYMSDEEYEEIYSYDDHSNEDRKHGQMYIGSYVRVLNNYLFNISVSVKSYYHFPYFMIQQYLSTTYPNVNTEETTIEIMKLLIVDKVYFVLLKTHWIRLIQRIWKKVYANRIKIIQLRKSISCQQYFENTGKYPLNACYLPSICGMIDIIRSKKFVK